MDRDIPAFNPIIVGQMQQKNLQMHQRRLINIRSSQNSRSYLAVSTNSRQNRKGLQVQQQRKTEIERHNLMLFNRMKKIMSRNHPSNRPILNLNKNNRMSAQLSRIEEQNRTMYQRIEHQKPTISNRKLEEDRRKNLNILKFLGKYSAHHIQNANAMSLRNSQGSSRGTLAQITQQNRNKIYSSKQEHYLLEKIEKNMQVKSQNREQDQFQEEVIDTQDFKINLQKMIQSKRKAGKAQVPRYQDTQQKQQQQSNYAGFKKSAKQSISAIPSSAKDIVLYKVNRKINEQIYQIKIIRKHTTYQISCHPLDDKLKSFVLSYDEMEGNSLLEESNYDYQSIIERLSIKQNAISLDGESFLHSDQQQTSKLQTKLQPSYAMHSTTNGNFKSAMKMYQNSSHITEQNQEESYRYVHEDHDYNHRRSVDEQDEGDSLGEPQEVQGQRINQQTTEKRQNQISQLHQVLEKNTSLPQQRQKQIQITFKPQPGLEEGRYEEALEEEII